MITKKMITRRIETEIETVEGIETVEEIEIETVVTETEETEEGIGKVETVVTEIEEIAIDVNQERAVTRVIEDHIIERNHPFIDENEHRKDYSLETIEIKLRIGIVERELQRDIEAEATMNNSIAEVQD